MKRNHIYFAACALAAIGLASCDSVSEPDRFVPAEIIPQRSILIEEFTGQECTNCPDGHAEIKNITASLGDSVVPVCIHASGLAIDEIWGGYKTATGEEYFKAVGGPAIPAAVINMQTSPLQVTAWGSTINRLIMTPTPFTVKASSSFDNLEMNVDVDFSAGVDYQGKLMVWLVENNLIGYQLDHGKEIDDYDHNHVFRAALTSDIWGEPVDLEAHSPQHLSFKYTVPAYWDKDNLYIVAFLYNNDGVAQVTSTAKSH